MIINDIIGAFAKVKEKKPLVHCITNYITANDCANVLLAIGASPTMANSIYEVEDVVKNASALVLNLGTLGDNSIKAMIKAGVLANKIGVPVVLDPVGVASISYRKESAFELLNNVKVNVIRGNMSEIKTLCGLKGIAKGVDSDEVIGIEDSKKIAKLLSKKIDSVVAITGVIDYISDGERVISIGNGNKMLTKVTGTGCMTTSLIGAYLGSGNNDIISAVSGVLSMGVAGEIAFENLKENEGSGSYRVKIIDGIFKMTEEDFIKRGKINE